MRANDPFRLGVASLIGCAWRTAAGDFPADQVQPELRRAGESAGAAFPRACADAAEFWRRRADSGLVDEVRARRAVQRLLDLAVDGSGAPVAASPREAPVTVRIQEWQRPEGLAADG